MHTGGTTTIHFEALPQTEVPHQEASQTSTHTAQTEEKNTSTNMTQSGGITTNANSIMNLVSATGCPKGTKAGTASHIQVTDTTGITTDIRVLTRQNNHMFKTPDHPRTDTYKFRPPTSVQNGINICGLNVYGLSSKLVFGELNDFIKKFDIFCITESKVSEGPHIENYTVFNLEKKTKKYPYPGIHGLQVYVEDHIAGLCSQISDISPICETVLWIKIS